MTSTQSELKRLWRVKKTVVQLCHDRGYLVTQDELDETQQEFMAIYKNVISSGESIREKLTMLFSHSLTKEKMYIFFPEEKLIKKGVVVNYCKKLQKEDVQRAIFVVKENLTTIAKKVFTEFYPKFILESFFEDELLVNIMEHELVPKHIILTPEEREEVYKKYNLTESAMIRILAQDPVARYFGLKRGQLVKIIRESSTAGRYVLYRLVV